jgi:hypothetical protein
LNQGIRSPAICLFGTPLAIPPTVATAQLVAQQNVDKPVDTSLQAIQVKAFSSVRNFLRTTAQEVAHFLVTHRTL